MRQQSKNRPGDNPLTSHRSPLTFKMRGIFRSLKSRATWLVVLGACGSRAPVPTATSSPAVSRILPLARVIVLETSGPPPSDTSVSFTTGAPHMIVMRHGPPENIIFARISFAATAFGDSGRSVNVDVRPRPGIYGLDITTSIPPRTGARVAFEFARYFSAPSRARQVYRTDAAFERALAVGRLLPDNQIELLPSIEPEIDKVGAVVPASGSYLVAAPQ